MSLLRKSLTIYGFMLYIYSIMPMLYLYTYPYQLYVTLFPFSSLCSCHFYNFVFRTSCRCCLQDQPPGQPLDVSTLCRTVIVCIYVTSRNKYPRCTFTTLLYLFPLPLISICMCSPPHPPPSPPMISHPDIRTSTSLPQAGTTSPQSNQTLCLL